MSLRNIVNLDNLEKEVEEGGGDFKALPEHDNVFLVVAAETKEATNSQAVYVEVRSEIIGDKYAGRQIFSNFYLIKKDGTENKVARVMYGQLCEACGVKGDDVYEPANLLNKQYSGTVKVVKSAGYDDKNEIKNPKAIGGTAPVSAPVVDTDDDIPFNNGQQQNSAPAAGQGRNVFAK